MTIPELVKATYKPQVDGSQNCAACDNLAVVANKGGFPRCNLTGDHVEASGGCGQFIIDIASEREAVKKGLADHEVDISRALGLGYPREYLDLLKQLRTPEDFQNWISNRFAYDHHSPESASFRGFADILSPKSKKIDCFRGMLVLVTFLHLRHYQPRVLLLQAGDNKFSEDHNVVAFWDLDSQNKPKCGATGFSSWSTLTYRLPECDSYDELAQKYRRTFTGDTRRSDDVVNLKGYAIIDLIQKYGEQELFRIIFSHGNEAKKLVGESYVIIPMGSFAPLSTPNFLTPIP